MQIGTRLHSTQIEELEASFLTNLFDGELLHYVCLVNDRHFWYLGITDRRLIFIEPNTLVATRFINFKQIVELRFNMGMWQVLTQAQPIAFFGFPVVDRKPVLQLFTELGLPIKH